MFRKFSRLAFKKKLLLIILAPNSPQGGRRVGGDVGRPDAPAQWPLGAPLQGLRTQRWMGRLKYYGGGKYYDGEMLRCVLGLTPLWAKPPFGPGMVPLHGESYTHICGRQF